MAPRIKAVNAYRPRIEQGNTVQKPCRRHCGSSRQGSPRSDHRVLPRRPRCQGGGIGTFTPSIDLDGYFSIAFRADPAMNFGLNIPSIFSGTILNREYIGKSSDELVNMWNEEHINDIITIVD